MLLFALNAKLRFVHTGGNSPLRSERLKVIEQSYYISLDDGFHDAMAPAFMLQTFRKALNCTKTDLSPKFRLS